MGLSSLVNIRHSERLLNCQRTASAEWVLQIGLTWVNHHAKNLFEACAVLGQKDPSRERAVLFSRCIPPLLLIKFLIKLEGAPDDRINGNNEPTKTLQLLPKTSQHLQPYPQFSLNPLPKISHLLKPCWPPGLHCHTSTPRRRKQRRPPNR